MKRVIRIHANDMDGKVVKLEAHTDQASYLSVYDQTRFVARVANALHEAMREAGFNCFQIKFVKRK